MERIISAAFSFLIGSVGVWVGFKQLRNRTRLNQWPTTKGRVIERGTFVPDVPNMGPPAFRHSPLVKYVYEVSGKQFINDRIRPKRIQLPQHNTKKCPEEGRVIRRPGHRSLQSRRSERVFPRPNVQGNAIHCRRRCGSGDTVRTVFSAGIFAQVSNARD